jgi:hypothetical protein
LSRKATLVASAEAMARIRARVTLGHCAPNHGIHPTLPTDPRLVGEGEQGIVGQVQSANSATGERRNTNRLSREGCSGPVGAALTESSPRRRLFLLWSGAGGGLSLRVAADELPGHWRNT